MPYCSFRAATCFMSLEKRAVTQDGVWKEKVEGLTLKIFKFVNECHVLLIPHIPKIIIPAKTTNWSKKGYRTFFIEPILEKRISKKRGR